MTYIQSGELLNLVYNEWLQWGDHYSHPWGHTSRQLVAQALTPTWNTQTHHQKHNISFLCGQYELLVYDVWYATIIHDPPVGIRMNVSSPSRAALIASSWLKRNWWRPNRLWKIFIISEAWGKLNPRKRSWAGFLYKDSLKTKTQYDKQEGVQEKKIYTYL